MRAQIAQYLSVDVDLRCEKLRMDSVMLEGILSHHPRRETLDRRTDAGRAEAFVKFAPADYAVFSDDFDEVVVSPTGVASEQFDASYLGYLRHGISFLYFLAIVAGDRIGWLTGSVVRRRSRCRG